MRPLYSSEDEVCIKLVLGELKFYYLRNIVGLRGSSEHLFKVCNHEFKVKPVSQIESFFFRNVQLCSCRHGYTILSISSEERESRKGIESICKAGNKILDLDYVGWTGGQWIQEGTDRR